MSKLAIRAEIIKLSRALGVETGSLAFLEDVPEDEIRHLRDAVYELLFNQDRKLFQRVAALARRIPVWLTVQLCERAFGPLLTARAAGEMPAKRAAEVARRTSTAFIADAAPELDPRSAEDLIHKVPVEKIAEVAQELIRRGDFITVGRFVDFVSDAAIRAVVETIDDEAVLRIGFFTEFKNRHEHLLRMMPPERLRAMVLLAKDESKDLWSEVLGLLIDGSYRLRHELGEFVAQQDEAMLNGLVRATQAQGLWGDVLPLISVMSESSQRGLVNLPILKDPAIQESIVRAADEQDLWGVVLPLVSMMDDAMRTAVGQILARQMRTQATLERAANAALLGEHWEALLDLVARMPPPEQQEFAAIARTLGEVDPELLARITRRAEVHGISWQVTSNPSP